MELRRNGVRLVCQTNDDTIFQISQKSTRIAKSNGLQFPPCLTITLSLRSILARPELRRTQVDAPAFTSMQSWLHEYPILHTSIATGVPKVTKQIANLALYPFSLLGNQWRISTWKSVKQFLTYF